MKDDLLVYDITVDPAYAKDGESLEIEQIAFVTQPAVLTKGFAFNGKHFLFKDDVKMRIAAPALIPMTIYRNDEFGEYYVRFSEEVIEELHMKLMRNLQNRGVFNTEHDPSKEAPAYILEAWLVGKDPKKDRSYSEFGIEVPKGTLFMVAQVTDREYYNQLVKEERTGFSIEGFLGMKLSQIINNKKHAMADMKLPDGEHTISDKVYVVKDGAVVEIKDKPEPIGLQETEKEKETMTKTKKMEEEAKKKEEAMKKSKKMEEIEEDVTEDVEMQEEIVEEEKKEEIKMQIDETELMTILQPKFEEIYAMIADLKNILDSSEEEEDSIEIEMPAEMSLNERFRSAMQFCKDNY